MTQRTIRTEYDREHWYAFPGYENRYEITRDGRVRSKPRYVNSPVAGGQRLIGGKMLKPSYVKGYAALQPIINGRRKIVYLHRAIAQLFIPNPDNKPEVNHKDGDRANNKPENLEWVTRLENMRHAYRTGLAIVPTSGPGELSPAAKLTWAKVREIRRRIANNECRRSLADEYGTSRSNINMIARNITWIDP